MPAFCRRRRGAASRHPQGRSVATGASCGAVSTSASSVLSGSRIDQIAFPQPFESGVVGFKTMTLEHGLARQAVRGTPGHGRSGRHIPSAPRVVYIVDPQQVAIAEM